MRICDFCFVILDLRYDYIVYAFCLDQNFVLSKGFSCYGLLIVVISLGWFDEVGLRFWWWGPRFIFFIFLFFYDKKGLIWHGIITLAHLNLNSIVWEHQSYLGPSLWTQHFKLKHHNLNHNPRICKADGSRNSYYQATTLPTNFFFP